jgi:hypothetical protein
MQSEPTPPASIPPAGEQIPVYDRSGSGTGWRGRILAGAACVLIGAGAGFALGRVTAPTGGPKTLAEAFQQAQQGKLPTGNLQGQPGQPGQGGPFGGQGNQGNQQGGNRGPGAGAGVQGDITAVSGQVLSISTPAGDLKVKLGGSTTIQKAVAAAKGDLAVGDTVSVRLDPSVSNGGDGTVTASSITKEPAQ